MFRHVRLAILGTFENYIGNKLMLASPKIESMLTPFLIK